MSRTPKSHDPLTAGGRELDTQIERGVVAGLVSAVPTVLILMVGGVIAGVGPWTPFYSVVALLDPTALLTALDDVGRGVGPEFYQSQFVAGLATCLGLGMVSGAVFAYGTRKYEFRGWVRYVLGVAHGVLMMCVFYLLVLHAVGTLVDETRLANSLARQVGWSALICAHAAHGLALAWLSRSRVVVTRSPFEHLLR